jgi:hypothetical protein
MRGAGRMGGQAFRRSGRKAAGRTVRRGGVQLARLDRYRGAHEVLLLGIYLFIPLLFDPDAAGDLDASFELRIRDPAGGDPDACSVIVAKRKCRVVFGADRKTRVIVTTGADDIIRMASGDIGWPQLVSAGRLSLWGDPFLTLRFPMLFGLPAGPGKPPSLLGLLSARRWKRR